MTRDTATTTSTHPRRRDGAMRVTRRKGAVSGILLIALGAWGALIPFIGPYASYAYTPDSHWTWTAGRFWLEILPGVATIIGGLIMLITANRAVAVLASYLAVAGGAWFVVGPILGQLWNGDEGAAGVPVGGKTARVVEQIGFFYGLGAVIVFLAAQALGRFTVRGIADVHASEKARERKTTDTNDTAGTDEPADTTADTSAAGRHRAEPQTSGTRVAVTPADSSVSSNVREVDLRDDTDHVNRNGSDGRSSGATRL
jgi:hypothetical protein